MRQITVNQPADACATVCRQCLAQDTARCAEAQRRVKLPVLQGNATGQIFRRAAQQKIIIGQLGGAARAVLAQAQAVKYLRDFSAHSGQYDIDGFKNNDKSEPPHTAFLARQCFGATCLSGLLETGGR